MPLWHFTHITAPFSEHQLGSLWWCSHSQASLWPQSGLLPGVSCGIGAVLWVPGRAPHACVSPTGWGGCLFPCEVHVSLQFHLVLRGGCEGQHRALRPAACPRHPAEKQAGSPGETHSLNAPFWDRWAHPQAGGSCSSFWTVETPLSLSLSLEMVFPLVTFAQSETTFIFLSNGCFPYQRVAMSFILCQTHCPACCLEINRLPINIGWSNQ